MKIIADIGDDCMDGDDIDDYGDENDDIGYCQEGEGSGSGEGGDDDNEDIGTGND